MRIERRMNVHTLKNLTWVFAVVLCLGLVMFSGRLAGWTALAASTIGAPTILTATTLSPFWIELSWKENATNEKSFQLNRHCWARGTTPNCDTTLSVPTKTTRYADNAVIPGVTYY